jgi:hypothetical protein
MANNKPLLIGSSVEKSGARGQWQRFDQPPSFIQGINTGNLDKEASADVLNTIVSGVPTPWARVKLFQYAFRYIGSEDSNIETSSLIEFYRTLINEWKGLIGLIALHPNHITFSEKIILDGKDERNLFDFSSAMGRMLFEDADIWTNPDDLSAKKKEAIPYIQLIYYKGTLVGGISPFTLFFSASSYKTLDSNIKWFRDYKLCDPLEFGSLDNNQLQKLYILANNIFNKLQGFNNKINQNRSANKISHNAVKTVIKHWISDIKAKYPNVNDDGTLDAEAKVEHPYYDLLNVRKVLYFNFDKSELTQNGNSDGIEIDTRQLLSQSTTIMEIMTASDNNAQNAVYLLRCDNRYFALPISHLGMYVFHRQVGEILNPKESNNGTKNHQINAKILQTKNKNGLLEEHLIINLFLCADDKMLTPISKEYIIEPIDSSMCITWPDFYSEFWQSYYFYSELPTNARGKKLYPFFRRPLSTGEDEIFFDKDKKIIFDSKDDLKIERLLKFPTTTNVRHKYEIVTSNYPVGGIELRMDIDNKEEQCGILLIKPVPREIGETQKQPLRPKIPIENLSPKNKPNEVVKVGIDFGSNNTCVSYAVGDKVSEPILFKNRRVFLLGNDVYDPDHKFFAEDHELLFFQNEEPNNGQVKSWIKEHDTLFVVGDKRGSEFAAGNPVFEPNLGILKWEEDSIDTDRGRILHNLKWRNREEGMNPKRGFLKVLWLKICAELYANKDSCPNSIELLWAYPSSLSERDRISYRGLYGYTAELKPIKGLKINVEEPLTEAEAVCNYALGRGELAVTRRSMMLGIDVGGSTSDILLVVKQESKNRLILQSSVRLAAGELSRVAKSFAPLAKALKYFIDSTNGLTINGFDDSKLDNAPYFLNAIFDRLDEEQFKSFYRHLGNSPDPSVGSKAKPLFALPTYISGILMFYTGQLAAYAIHKNKLTEIDEFDLYPFGKGGRIFDWLSNHVGEQKAKEYYEKCFRAGLNLDLKIDFNYKSANRKDTKSEVSYGLSAIKQIDVGKKEIVDLLGEEGFYIYDNLKNKDCALESDDFKNIAGIEPPRDFVQFNKFIDIFLEVAGPRSTGFLNQAQPIKDKVPELRRKLINFIVTDPQYVEAEKDRENFSYSQPLIILLAMCFLKEFIVPELTKN